MVEQFLMPTIKKWRGTIPFVKDYQLDYIKEKYKTNRFPQEYLNVDQRARSMAWLAIRKVACGRKFTANHQPQFNF